MIASIRGKVLEVGVGSLIIDTNGIGYLVKVTNTTLQSIRTDNETSLFTHMAVRENSMDLYGFPVREELDFFGLLITISGIGPKSALAILDSSSIETLKEGIMSGDASYLTKVSGIGKKSAEKIIIELRDKLGTLDLSGGVNTEGSGAAIEALVSLGYSERDARDVISKIDRSLSTEEIIKEALKNLG
ncbi:MAG: Holliday junction DNA helicase RuvA [Candidatus Paceibacteria bacterium]|jgi:Holliday junction DNA helicase RuvA